MTRAVTCRSAAAAAAAAAATPITAAAAAAASDLLSAQPLDNKTRVFFISCTISKLALKHWLKPIFLADNVRLLNSF